MLLKHEIREYHDKKYYVIAEATRSWKIPLIEQIRECKLIKIGAKLVHFRYLNADGNVEDVIHKARIDGSGIYQLFSTLQAAKLHAVRSELVSNVKDNIQVLSSEKLIEIAKLIKSCGVKISIEGIEI